MHFMAFILQKRHVRNHLHLCELLLLLLLLEPPEGLLLLLPLPLQLLLSLGLLLSPPLLLLLLLRQSRRCGRSCGRGRCRLLLRSLLLLSPPQGFKLLQLPALLFLFGGWWEEEG